MSAESKQCCWQLSPIDTWFFKEARHHDGSGAHLLTSLFPPPVRTLVGAIRTAIGDTHQVYWPDFSESTDVSMVALRQQMGPELDQEYGQLEFCGPWLSREGKRLYPTPASLLEVTPLDCSKEERVERASISELLICDLGQIYQTHMEVDHKYRSIGGWLTEVGFNAFLNGRVPESECFISEDDLLSKEARLGIALDNSRRTTQRSMLYQTEHLRTHHEVEVGVELEMSFPKALGLPKKEIVRLGGEGRMAHMEKCSPRLLPRISVTEESKGCSFILMLLTPMEIEPDAGPLHLPNFLKQERSDGINYWSGELMGINISAYSLIAGKHGQEGGWDIAKKRPRPASSLLPAGSCWYCQSDASLEEAVKELNGKKIGKNTHLGRGQLAVALWPEQAISMESSS